MDRLKGKVAIITGSGGGIGKAAAKLFVEEGASVVVAEIDEAAGKAVAAELNSPRAVYIHLDAGDEESWRDLIAATLKQFGSLQIIIVNNAAFRTPLTIEQTSLEAWNANQRVTSAGIFLGTKMGGEAITGKGSIVNLSSIGGFVGLPESFPYSAAKGAVRALSRSAALHFARQKRDIRVNVIGPGATLTEAIQRQAHKLAEREKTTCEAVMARLTSDVPLGRMADPREVANAILFLASDEASFITGAELLVDGGFTAS